MLGKILKALGAIGVVLAPILFTYYLNRSMPDVRYTLSEKIPVAFADPNNLGQETVQQLEVKNIGNAQADRIVIKIEGQITAYSVQKYSTSDVVQVYDNQQSFEIDYPSLPPQTGFRMVFKSPNNGIDDSKLTITHNTGIANNALADSRTNALANYGFWIYLVGFVVYMSLSTNSFRKEMIDLWKAKKSGLIPEKSLNLNKPWYVLESEWNSIRSDVLKESLKRTYNWKSDINKNIAYQFLTINDTGKIEATDWKEIVELAVGVLDTDLSLSVNSAYLPTDILKLLRLSKPTYFPTEKWDQFLEEANKQFIKLGERDIYTASKAIKFLKTVKPEEVTDDAWGELVLHSQKIYGEDLFHTLSYQYDLLEYAKSADTSPLANDQRNVWEHLKKVLENVDVLEKENTELLRMFHLLLDNSELDLEKPDCLDDLDWSRLQQIEELVKNLQELETRNKDIESRYYDVTLEGQRISQLKCIVEGQLRFINELIQDPSVIDRVESYDITFAKGNFENLRKMAQLLERTN